MQAFFSLFSQYPFSLSVCHYLCPMNIEIISIGDELLIGQVVNTNAAWMAEELNRNGFRVHQISVISDMREHILQGLKEAGDRADVVLVSGGLGPTKDDITKQAVCEFFDTRLVFNTEAFRDIRILFGKRGWGTISDLNRKQAELPENSITLPNYIGTARGMWMEKVWSSKFKVQSTIFIFLPGVPFELKDMLTREVIPRLKERFISQAIFHKTVLTQGMGESMIAEIVEEWENNLPGNIKLAYLPQPGIVRLRLTATGDELAALRREAEKEAGKLRQLIPDLIFGYDDDTLEAIAGRLLLEKNRTLSVAESCTGGYIASLITSVPGSSAWFTGSVVAYANRVKEDILYVKRDTLEKHGAVSEQTAMEMALGAKSRFRSDYAIATSGVAGPTGGTVEKPVGTVWIGIATPDGVSAKHFLFGDNRERNIRITALTALNLLRRTVE
jgi:nicotinamide-nucleotide amidase